ncbi:LysM peptidoglycan-binding domain-containing protein [Tenacibaculum holothuriorum]|uniref:LysM peptidoglycan-binding domain-containing protein n=1 Tax=Tenacibaculum holothuriorum TaxID=1635173 RepID=UPI000A321172|nr:LysM domain-containing protein [Tenacibaculum holothuriorum]
MKKLLLLFLLFNCSLIFSQGLKLPKGWSLISLKGKPAYINLTTGKITREKPKAKKVDLVFEDDDDDEIFDPTITHVVKKGETVTSIAKKYDLKVDVLYLLNSDEELKTLAVGKEIIIGYAHTMDEKKEFLNGNIKILKHDEHDH